MSKRGTLIENQFKAKLRRTLSSTDLPIEKVIKCCETVTNELRVIERDFAIELNKHTPQTPL